MDFGQLDNTNVFNLISRIGSFNRKQELENAQQWFSREIDKLKEQSSKPKGMDTNVNMQPVNQDLVLQDLIEARFEN